MYLCRVVSCVLYPVCCILCVVSCVLYPVRCILCVVSSPTVSVVRYPFLLYLSCCILSCGILSYCILSCCILSCGILSYCICRAVSSPIVSVVRYPLLLYLSCCILCWEVTWCRIPQDLSFGGDSNGSGVSAVLEVARLLSKLYRAQHTHPRTNMLFVLPGGGYLNYQVGALTCFLGQSVFFFQDPDIMLYRVNR